MAGHDKLTTDGEKLLQELEELTSKQIRVGIQRGEKHKSKPSGKRRKPKKDDDGPDLVDVALWNELGTDTIPSRPFLAQTADQHGDEIKDNAVKMVEQLLNGRWTAKDTLNRIGVMTVGFVQNQIKDGDFVPNAPSTVRMKQSEQPLIDTAQLRQSIRHKICPKGEDDDV